RFSLSRTHPPPFLSFSLSLSLSSGSCCIIYLMKYLSVTLPFLCTLQLCLNRCQSFKPCTSAHTHTHTNTNTHTQHPATIRVILPMLTVLAALMSAHPPPQLCQHPQGHGQPIRRLPQLHHPLGHISIPCS